MLEIILLLGGLIGLWLGSDIAVDAARKLALKLGVSELLIGLTLASIGTSVPEITTNIIAGFQRLGGVETSGIAVGNVIGSCASQISIIMGLCALIIAVRTKPETLFKDGRMMLLSLFAVLIISIDLVITPFEGIYLIIVYLVYIAIVAEREHTVKSIKNSKEYYFIDLIISLLALGFVLFSAWLFVEYGVIIARSFGISELIIGLFVGIATSLPEFSISLRALLKGSHEIALGNIIGSNITAALLALGAGAAVSGFIVAPAVVWFAIPACFAITSIALYFLWTNQTLSRLEAIAMIIIYIIFMYLSYLWM